MVAKINRGASLYGAIIYNQQKVNEDTARIIAGNRMITDSLYDPDRIVRQTMFAFESYLAANRNTEKPILHISLNPTLDDNLTDSQFVDLARAYMQKMGYGNQPYIVYLHEDIDRRHIHIVSTCVNENGEKIDDALRVEPLDEGLPRIGADVRTQADCRQTQGVVGALSEEGGLHPWRCKAAGIEHP